MMILGATVMPMNASFYRLVRYRKRRQVSSCKQQRSRMVFSERSGFVDGSNGLAGGRALGGQRQRGWGHWRIGGGVLVVPGGSS